MGRLRGWQLGLRDLCGCGLLRRGKLQVWQWGGRRRLWLLSTRCRRVAAGAYKIVLVEFRMVYRLGRIELGMVLGVKKVVSRRRREKIRVVRTSMRVVRLAEFLARN